LIRRVLLIFMFFLFPLAIQADIIHLKNGDRFEGFFLKMDGPYLVFKTEKGNVRIHSSTLKKIQILYTGVTVCYLMREDMEKKDCSGVLHTMSSEHVIIASRDRKSKKKTIKLPELELLEFKKKNKNQKIMPLLRPGLKIKLLLTNKELSGEISSIRENLMTFRMPDGNEKVINENELIGGVYAPPLPRMFVQKTPEDMMTPKSTIPSRTFFDNFKFTYLFPGFPQLKRGDTIKGYSIIGGFGFLAAGFYMEYQAAVGVSSAASGDPGLLLFNASNHKSKFDAHQRNQMAIGFVSLLLYAYHIFDSGMFSSSSYKRPAHSFSSGKPRRPFSFGGRVLILNDSREMINEVYFRMPLR